MAAELAASRDADARHEKVGFQLIRAPATWRMQKPHPAPADERPAQRQLRAPRVKTVRAGTSCPLR